MALITCKKCNKTISSKTKECIYCGFINDIENKPNAEKINDATLIIQTTSHNGINFMEIELYLDDVLIGKIKKNETKEFNVSSGFKNFYVKSDCNTSWFSKIPILKNLETVYKTEPIKFVLMANETKKVEIGTNIAVNSFLKLMFYNIYVMYYTFFSKKNYLYIKIIYN